VAGRDIWVEPLPRPKPDICNKGDAMPLTWPDDRNHACVALPVFSDVLLAPYILFLPCQMAQSRNSPSSEGKFSDLHICCRDCGRERNLLKCSWV